MYTPYSGYKKYIREELIFMSVHELRAVARDVGVRSPSNKKKSDLIDNILAIADKRQSPEFNINRVGRPPIDMHKNAHIPYSESSNNDYDGIFTLNSNIVEYGVPTFDEKRGRKMHAVLDYIEGGIGVVRRNYFDKEKIFLPKNIILSDKLREGDIIYGKEELSPDKETWVVISVKESLNYMVGADRPEFDKLVKYSVSEKGQSNILGEYTIGDSCYITCDKRQKVKEISDALFEEASKTGLTFAINYNSTSEATKDLSNTLEVNFALDEEVKLRGIAIMLEHIKRRVEIGEDVRLIFSNFSEYLRSLNIVNQKQITTNISLESVQTIRKIAGMSGNFEKGSLTICFVDSLTVPDNYKEVIKYDVISNLNTTFEL